MNFLGVGKCLSFLKDVFWLLALLPTWKLFYLERGCVCTFWCQHIPVPHSQPCVSSSANVWASISAHTSEYKLPIGCSLLFQLQCGSQRLPEQLAWQEG